MPSPIAKPVQADDRAEAVQRYLDRLAVDSVRDDTEVKAGRARRVGTVLGLWPMLAVAALPITGLIGAVVGATLRPIGWGAASFAATSVVLLLIASTVAVVVLRQPSQPRDRSPRHRRVVVGLTAAFAVMVIAEVVSGGRFANAMLLAWPLSFAWTWLFLNEDRIAWSRWRVALWAIAPVGLVVVVLLEVSAGLFALRFEASRADLETAASSIAAGEKVRSGTEVGMYEVVILRDVPGCDASFVIDGWWKDDKRWIAWCSAGRPDGVRLTVRSIGHDWYEITSD